MKNISKLYRATIKQLSIPAVIMVVLSVVSSVLYLGGKVKEISEYGYGYGMFFRDQPTAFAMAPSLVVMMFLGPLVMGFIAFEYLNKRNASDFHHSLPYTRLENYWSRVLAILTYQAAIIVLTMIGSIVVLTLNGVSYNLSFIPMLLLGYVACSLLVTGAVVLGKSVTGTLLSNAMVAGLILFLPRMLLFVIDQFIISMAGYHLIVGHMGVLLNPVYNIATASLLDITGIWEYYGLSETLINPGSIVYTGVLGIAYIMLAMLLMKKRPSEMAGRGAMNDGAASIFSGLISLPILIVGVYALKNIRLSEMRYSELMRILIVLVIALVIFIVVGYVLSTKWKTVFKSLPVFAVAFLAALGIIFASTWMAKDMVSYLPDRDKIEYIQINENEGSSYRYKPVYDYNALLASEIEFKDDAVVDLFYALFEDNVSQWKMQMEGVRGDAYSSYGDLICEFKLKNGRTVYRNVNLYVKYIDELYDVFMKNEAYVKAYTQLPTDGELSSYEDIDLSVFDSTWESYQSEFGSKSVEDQVYLNTFNSYSQIFSYKYQNRQSPRYVTGFQVYGNHNGKPYIEHVNISTLTPKSANYYMRTVNQLVSEKLIDDLTKVVKEPKANFSQYINISMPSNMGNYVNFMYSTDIDDEELEYMPDALTKDEMLHMIDILALHDLKDISVTQPYVEVYFSQYGTYANEGEYYTCYVPISQEEADALTALYQEKMDLYNDYAMTMY